MTRVLPAFVALALAAGLRLVSVSPAVSSGGTGWSATGELSKPRYNASATELSGGNCADKCGNVLVAGGSGDSSAELYDPATGSWRQASGMNGVRSAHTATLITGTNCADKCGKVLVAGGSSDAHTELYDPGSGGWPRTGDMLSARAGHVAIQLPDAQGCAACGKVLVAGGTGPSGSPVSSAELYDPTIGRWLPTGPMTKARAKFTATLVNGKVLVAGGNGCAVIPLQACAPLVERTSEVYDPTTGTWSSGPDLNAARSSFAATLLGGPNCAQECGDVLVVGGRDGGGASIGSSELYNGQSWTYSNSSMTQGRLEPTALPLQDGSGRVMAAGGGYDSGATSSAEVYDPGSGTWASTGGMSTARQGQVALVLSGPALGTSPCTETLVAAGSSGGANASSLGSAEIYNALPRISRLGTTSGPTTGGSAVTISGGGLGGVTSVRFGDTSVAPASVSDTQVSVSTPAHAAGPAQVVVSTATCQSRPTPSAQFTYVGSPSDPPTNPGLGGPAGPGPAPNPPSATGGGNALGPGGGLGSGQGYGAGQGFGYGQGFTLGPGQGYTVGGGYPTGGATSALPQAAPVLTAIAPSRSSPMVSYAAGDNPEPAAEGSASYLMQPHVRDGGEAAFLVAAACVALAGGAGFAYAQATPGRSRAARALAAGVGSHGRPVRSRRS